NPNQHNTQVAWSSSSADDIHTAQPSLATLSSSPKLSHLTASFESALPPPILQNDVIASLPNCVVESARRASSHEPGSFPQLAKAPGDVSMSPHQLILCLSTASKKLSPVRYSFHSNLVVVFFLELFSPVYLLLHSVISAIDREKFDDAQIFYERLRAEFPDEMGPWAQQGIRLLISELRRPASRIGSAGPHIRAQ
ncbi:hypothetical protein OSTOST_12618, partial [Ostertagia ostertagi]